MSSDKVKSIRTGVFIDGSNLFWAMNMRNDITGEKSHYNICFEKLREFLKHKYSPVFLNYYGVEDNNPKSEPYITRALGNKKFHKRLDGLGYNVLRKNLKYIGDDVTKGDTDMEIGIDMNKYENDYDNIVLISGDSDFLSAIEYFHSKGKHIRIYSFEKTLAWELKEFAIKNPRCNYKLLDDLKDKLEFFPKIKA